jgi:hypothetical protein
MTWIKTVPPDAADYDNLRRVYEAIYSLYPTEYRDAVPEAGTDSIVAAHSLIPEAMRHMMSGLGVLLQPNMPLTRRQQEMIAAVVSVRNHCLY